MPSISPIQSLLVHKADVCIRQEINTNGRLTITWVRVGEISCRFTLPTVMTVPVVNGVVGQKFATRVFAGLDFLDLINNATPPIRLITTSDVWTGTYETIVSPQAFTSHHSLHHVELDVVRVEHE